jgi:nitrate reductase delta subunit
MHPELYNSLAALLSYPGAGYAAQLGDALTSIPNGQAAIRNELATFADATRDMHVSHLQELFIQTFDLSPVCSLEMGWHLFGENYDRGLLLVKMRQQLRTHAIPETSELPDHLTNGLRLVPVMEHEEGAYFVEAVVFPALGKMIAALEGKQNPYLHVLLAARNLLRADFPEIQFAATGKTPELHVLAEV